MSFKNLMKNIKYLRKIDLKEKLDKNNLMSVIESMKYELLDDFKETTPPIIKTVDETIDEIIATKHSICRFGDGELNLIYNNSIPFQVSSPALSARLAEVLSSSKKETLIAIPRICYYSKKNVNDINKYFWRNTESHFREILERHIDLSNIFYSTEVSQAYTLFQQFDLGCYFNRIREIWEDRDITIICGETIFHELTYNIFDNAKTIDYQYAPSINAFEQYDAILEKTKILPSSQLIIIILGPTATVLAYDLSCLGFQALDFGHIAKSYDWYRKEKKIHHLADAFNFFNPD